MAVGSFKWIGAERVLATPICAQAQVLDPNDQINQTINRERVLQLRQQQQLQDEQNQIDRLQPSR